MRRWLLALALAGTAAAQTPPTLEEVGELARGRFEAERPAQLAALQPFRDDLKIVYDATNRQWLDRRFAMAADLGDSIVPALLQWLSPPLGGGAEASNIAGNSARILLRIGPAGFSNSLIEIVEAQNYIGRQHAIWLLGHTRSREAATVLTRLLDRPHPTQRIAVIIALKRMRALQPAQKIAGFLTSAEPTLRFAALDYLAETNPPSALEAVLKSMAAEESPDGWLEVYVRYLEGAAPRNAMAAEALLRKLQPDGVDREQLLLVTRSLARIAPVGHRETIRRCKSVLELGATENLGLACAVTMHALGDRSGYSMLEKRLTTLIRRERDKDDHFVSRGHMYRAMGRWREASNDYQEAVERTENRGLKRDLYLLVALCEAELERWSNLLRALKKSKATYQNILFAAEASKAFTNALSHRTIRRYLDELPRAKSGNGSPEGPKR